MPQLCLLCTKFVRLIWDALPDTLHCCRLSTSLTVLEIVYYCVATLLFLIQLVLIFVYPGKCSCD